jgi:hypothetical protein
MSQLAQIDMTPEETALLEREATRLARLLSASEKFTAEAANPPVPGSRMDHAYTADLRDAYGIAELLILACGLRSSCLKRDHCPALRSTPSCGQQPTR